MSDLLVLTLYSGENEFQRMLDSLSDQKVNFDHKVFKGLPNKKAHDLLYRKIAVSTDSYRFFLKLDADMVLGRDDALKLIMEEMSRPRLDHAIFPVHDWMSKCSILGAHAYSSRVSWSTDSDDLFVDPNPSIPGDRSIISTAPNDLIIHSPDPSPYQAFYFGYHRCLKATELRWGYKSSQALLQWRILYGVLTHWLKGQDRRAALACLGASEALNANRNNLSESKKEENLKSLFEKHKDKNANQLEDTVRESFYTIPKLLSVVTVPYFRLHGFIRGKFS
jgi:hypothetical protein